MLGESFNLKDQRLNISKILIPSMFDYPYLLKTQHFTNNLGFGIDLGGVRIGHLGSSLGDQAKQTMKAFKKQ